MYSSRQIRKLLNRLVRAGILIDYSMHFQSGQTVMIRERNGRPRTMRLGTAKQYLISLERQAG